LGYSVYFFFENNGVKLTTASAASIIIATLPVFTVVADALIFGYKLDMLKIFGVFLSVFGVYFVVGANLSEVGGSSLGYVYMFGAVLSWVAYSFVTRPLARKYSGIAVVFYQSLFGTIALIPFVFMEKTDWAAVSSPIIFNLLFLGIICSALANYLYVYAMDGLGVSLTSLFMNMVPVVTVITSFFILGETINLRQVIGGIFVVLSVYLVSMERKKNGGKS
jgi:drug/metabolite transporter (DMT)-like permease